MSPDLANVVLRPAPSLAIVARPERVSIQDLDRLTEPVRILADTAASVWAAVDGTRTVAEVCADLAEAYEVDVAVVEADVLPLLQQLLDEGYLVPTK